MPPPKDSEGRGTPGRVGGGSGGIFTVPCVAFGGAGLNSMCGSSWSSRSFSSAIGF